MCFQSGQNLGFSQAHNPSNNIAPWTHQRFDSVHGEVSHAPRTEGIKSPSAKELPSPSYAEMLQLLQQQTDQMNRQNAEDEAAAAEAAAMDHPLLAAYVMPQPSHNRACPADHADNYSLDLHFYSPTSEDVLRLQSTSLDTTLLASIPTTFEMCLHRGDSVGGEFVTKNGDDRFFV